MQLRALVTSVCKVVILVIATRKNNGIYPIYTYSCPSVHAMRERCLFSRISHSRPYQKIVLVSICRVIKYSLFIAEMDKTFHSEKGHQFVIHCINFVVSRINFIILYMNIILSIVLKIKLSQSVRLVN